MPFICMLSTILIGWVVGLVVIDEMETNGESYS